MRSGRRETRDEESTERLTGKRGRLRDSLMLLLLPLLFLLLLLSPLATVQRRDHTVNTRIQAQSIPLCLRTQSLLISLPPRLSIPLSLPLHLL